MKCSAHRQDGVDCQAQAIKGGTVCRVHGGSAPQVKQAAMIRLLEAIDPAAGELIRIALKGKTDQVRVQAIKELFERAGFGEAKRIDITLTDDVLDAEIARLEAELAGNDT